MMATSTTRSLNLLGRVRGSVIIWARDSIWKTDGVGPAAHLIDPGVVQGKRVEVGTDAGRALGQLQRLGDHRDGA
jgi:hypothetical protein